MGDKIFTHWKRPAMEIEYNSGELIVEPSSMRKTSDMIQEITNAGANLTAQRMANYDYARASEDDGYTPPDRSPGFDIMDRYSYYMEAKRRIKKWEDEQANKPEPEPEPEPTPEPEPPTEPVA